MKKDKSKQPKGINVIHASKAEVIRATKKCLKKYPDVFKELAKR